MKVVLSLTDQSFKATKSIGIFNVSMGLARGLMQCREVEELHLLCNEECADAFRDAPPHVVLHELDRPVPRRFSRVWWDQVGVSRAIRRICPDWAILPKGFPPFFSRQGKTRLACYVHDVNWEYYEKMPHHAGGTAEVGEAGNSEASPFPRHELLYFRTLGLRALRVADLVLTSTLFNRERFLAHVPQARVAVVGIGFDDAPALPEHREGRDVLFYASRFPHKLTRTGVQRLESWLRQREDGGDIRIHVIGSLPPGQDLPDSRWILHGRLPQKELQQLMEKRCRCSVYFSDYEGYGMPPVESLRAGIPCVASHLPPIAEHIPEVYLFDNGQEISFLRTMNRAYDATEPVVCPPFPSWQEVAKRCVSAMSAAF